MCNHEFSCNVGDQIFYFGEWGHTIAIYGDRIVSEITESGITSVKSDIDTGETSDMLFIPWNYINHNVFFSYENAKQVMISLEIHSIKTEEELRRKSIPEVPIKDSEKTRRCPRCYMPIQWDATAEAVAYAPHRCQYCNQSFDWSHEPSYIREDF